jgi:hypothetical protein
MNVAVMLWAFILDMSVSNFDQLTAVLTVSFVVLLIMQAKARKTT